MPDDPTARFAALVAARGPDLPLDEAALLIAAHAIAGLDLSAQQARLDEVAADVEEPTVDALVAHLVGRLGFTGDRASYHDARNSLLPEVLDRRRGIPLTLSVLAIEVGRRCGLPLVGIGMPGHFLARPSHADDRYLDLFDGGRILDRSGCRSIFQRLHPGVAWEESYLAPVPATAIISRMLLNLANAYRRSGDRPALAWAVALRLELPGATEHERRELAVLLGASGRYDRAAELLEGTGEQRDQEAAARLRARLN